MAAPATPLPAVAGAGLLLSPPRRKEREDGGAAAEAGGGFPLGDSKPHGFLSFFLFTFVVCILGKNVCKA